MTTNEQKELHLAVSQGYCLICGGAATDFQDAESQLLFTETGICQECQDTDAAGLDDICPDCECLMDECGCWPEGDDEEED